MVAAIDAQDAAWTANIEARNATMAGAAAAARQAIAGAKTTMVKALDASEKEIRWAITSIYNYDYQDALNHGLDDAREAMDAICDARIEALESQVVAVEAAWAVSTSSNTGSLNVNTDEEQQRCEEAKDSNTAIFTAFKDAQWVRFEEWAANETAELEAFVAECEAAWQWILVSYCLHHGHEGVEGVGRGCEYANGAGFGNAGYNKGVPVEDFDGILSYEQDLYIKHIHNLD